VYEARANTSLDRMEIIKTVAKLVPEPHSVDLKNPDKTIIVQIVKVRKIHYPKLQNALISYFSNYKTITCSFHVNFWEVGQRCMVK
jgi:tRNA(Ser,Leu) C12 N-acetylase TAN1